MVKITLIDKVCKNIQIEAYGRWFLKMQCGVIQGGKIC